MNKTQPHPQGVLIPTCPCQIHRPELNEQMLQLKLEGLECQLHNPEQWKISKSLSEMNSCTHTHLTTPLYLPTKLHHPYHLPLAPKLK